MCTAVFFADNKVDGFTKAMYSTRQFFLKYTLLQFYSIAQKKAPHWGGALK